jgi:hypothetical protein
LCELESDIQKAVLADIIDFKLTIKNLSNTPIHWEVFFCHNQLLYKAYVTPYTAWFENEVINFYDWYEVPERYVETMQYSTIEMMLKRIDIPMYYIGFDSYHWENGTRVLQNTRIDFDEQVPTVPIK